MQTKRPQNSENLKEISTVRFPLEKGPNIAKNPTKRYQSWMYEIEQKLLNQFKLIYIIVEWLKKQVKNSEFTTRQT